MLGFKFQQYDSTNGKFQFFEGEGGPHFRILYLSVIGKHIKILVYVCCVSNFIKITLQTNNLTFLKGGGRKGPPFSNFSSINC